jgi:hypothetical protein
VTAKRKFCESQSLRDWSLHADRIKISAAVSAWRSTASISMPSFFGNTDCRCRFFERRLAFSDQ